MNRLKQLKSLPLSLSIAIHEKNLKYASDLLSSACDSQGKLDNKVMLILLSGCGVDFLKDDNYVEFLLKVFKVSPDDTDDLVAQLETAVLKGNIDEVEALLSSSDLKEVLLSKNDANCLQPFILYAFSCCNIDIRLQLLKLINDSGVMNPKVLDKELGNLLHIFLLQFARSSDEDLLDLTVFLVDAGVSLEETDGIGRTPLHISICRKLVKVVSFFIYDKNVNVNAKTNTGCTPLHIAVMDRGDIEGHVDIIQILLSKKDIDVNAENIDGATPLLITQKYFKNEKIVELLLQNGAHDVKYSPFSDTTFTPEQQEIMSQVI